MGPPDGSLWGYYINFRLPIRRSAAGFDTLDLDLDVVVDPEYRWSWKDEAEFFQGIADGGIRAEWAVGIEAAKKDLLARIDRRSYPIDNEWLTWRPDPSWQLLARPENWAKY